MVTHEAIELFRKNEDHMKAISYTNAFSGSHLLTLITKLVTSELGTQGRESQLKGSSPATFLRTPSLAPTSPSMLSLSVDALSSLVTNSLMHNRYAFFGQDILEKANFGYLEVEEEDDNPISGIEMNTVCLIEKRNHGLGLYHI